MDLQDAQGRPGLLQRMQFVPTMISGVSEDSDGLICDEAGEKSERHESEDMKRNPRLAGLLRGVTKTRHHVKMCKLFSAFYLIQWFEVGIELQITSVKLVSK
jgi:hypothetical protein